MKQSVVSLFCLSLVMLGQGCVLDPKAERGSGTAVQCLGDGHCTRVGVFPTYVDPKAPQAVFVATMNTAGGGTSGTQQILTSPAKGTTKSGVMAMMMMAAAMKASGSGGASGASAAGSGGASGTSAAGSGGVDPNTPGALKCPMEVCAPLPEPSANATAMGFKITLCCADNGQCGTSLNDAACAFTPDSDPQCPKIEIMSYMVPACCTMDGKCGLDGSAFQMPCSSIEDVNAQVMGAFTLPPPQKCTPTAK